jgi:polar amino acid transport system substrate-binding protein
VLVLLALAGAVVAPLRAADPIDLRADLWFPVNGHPQAARPGFGIEILRRIWPPGGYALQYRLQPWSRSLNLVREGRADCVIGAYPTDAPDFRYPGEPLAFDSAALYVADSTRLRYDGLDSLLGLRLGAIADYSYGARFDQWLERHAGRVDVKMIAGKNALEKNLRKLISGRLDVLVASPLVMQAKLESMRLASRVRMVTEISDPMPIFVACTPAERSRAWLEAYDQGLRRMRADGTLDAIYRRYGINPERQSILRRRWMTRHTPDGIE